MTEADLGRRLLTVPVPEELEAGRRAWALVRADFERREPVPWARRRARPLLILALTVALLAAAVTPPGRGLAERLREAVSTPPPEPLSLPAEGRLLVVLDDGPWIVQADGSKRLLGAYEEAGWSPRGLFVVATRARTLVAVEPTTGRVRWTLSRPAPVSQPQWAPSGFRIVYRSGNALRIVAGDGTADRLLARSAGDAAPVWRPGSTHVLAFVDRRGRIRILNADARRRAIVVATRTGVPGELAWSPDGRRLLALAGGRVEIYTAAGRRIEAIRTPPGRTARDLALAPERRQFALITYDTGTDTSSVLLAGLRGRAAPRTLFTGEGRFEGLAWSPNGQWLLVGWPDADQWVFLRAPSVRRVMTASGVAREFDPGGSGPGRFPRIVSWCCPR